MQKKHRLEKVHHRRKWLISANIPIIWSAQWAPIALKVCAPYGRPVSWGEDLRLTNANECETVDDKLTFVWVLRNWLRDSQFSSQDCISETPHKSSMIWHFSIFYKKMQTKPCFFLSRLGTRPTTRLQDRKIFPFWFSLESKISQPQLNFSILVGPVNSFPRFLP